MIKTVTNSIFFSATAAFFQPYYCGGTSPASLWTLYLTDGLTMLIDTSSCAFTAAPLYFTSMEGNGHWTTAGYTAIYSRTATSFRVFVRPLVAGSWSNTAMLTYAQTVGWDINWLGIKY